MDLKTILLDKIKYENLTKQELFNLITISKENNMGDYALPCFSFAKTLHRSPMQIAEEIKNSLILDGFIEKAEVVNGYLNFFLNKKFVALKLLESFKDGFKPCKSNKKVVCIDYSSVNLAKYMHIGHWSTTIIGESIARLYENQGYKVYRLNYIGDYGLPFGKMVYAYLKWGNKEAVEKNGIDEIQNLYVRFCKEENEELLSKAREISKKIEDKDKEIYPIYEWVIKISKSEAKRILDKVGIVFDSWKGESSYNDKMQPVIDEIKSSGLGKISEGALIVDLSEYNLGVSVIQRSDGASLYVTRDLAALEDRYNTYKFDEMIYVTAVQQCNHFEKLFKLCELLKKPYANKLYHAYYGMFSTPEGKIASRKGKQALFEDILFAAEKKVREQITNRDLSKEQKDELVKKIGKSAVAFSVLKVDRIKDKIFEVEKATSLDGETSPYIQYTLARCCSLLNKAKTYNIDINCNYADLEDENSFNVIYSLLKTINEMNTVIYSAFEKKETSILARYILDLCKAFNKFYVDVKVLDLQNVNTTKIYLMLVKTIKNALEYMMPLLCIDLVEYM